MTARRIIGVLIIVFIAIPVLFGVIWAVGMVRATVSAEFLSDLPQEIIQALGITVVPLFINIGDKGFLDGVDITRTEFYVNLPRYSTHPTTGTPGTDAFLKAFKALVARGCTEILTIHISKSLSATVDVARTAAEEFREVPVTVRDSGQLSLGTGFQVEVAARMVSAGRSMTEILKALDGLYDREKDFDRQCGVVSRLVDLSTQEGEQVALLEKLKSNLQEVRARGGELYVFADPESGIEPSEGVHVIHMPRHVSYFQSPIIYTLPLQRAFSTTALDGGDWLLCTAVASSVLWLRELAKALRRATGR